jgi:hypothetical protein
MLTSEDKRLTSSLPQVNLGRSRLFGFGFVALLGVVVVLLGRLILPLHPCVVGVGAVTVRQPRQPLGMPR